MRSNQTQTKKNNGSSKSKPGNAKDLALSLGGKLGKGLISGLVPVIIGAVAKAASKALPGPQMANSSSRLAVSIPSGRGAIVRGGKPQMRTQGNGNCVVKHREYIADLRNEAQGFDLQFQFGVNPGNSALFPWLSQLATRFDCYKIRHLSVCYEPQTSTQTTGTVMIAVDYDASDAAPSSKVQMMSYKSAVRSVPWSECNMTCSNADLHRLKTNYVLSGTPPPNTDIKTYDIGNLYIALQTDQVTDLTVGELYVDYEIELITPQITYEVPGAAIYLDGTPTVSQFFGPNPTVQGSLPVLVEEIDDVTYLTIQNPGYYQLVLTTGNYDTPLINVITNGNVATELGHGEVTQPGSPGSATMQFQILQILDNSQPQISFAVSDFATGPTAFLTISPYSSDALPNATFSGPSVPVNDLRMRLGRRRRIPS